MDGMRLVEPEEPRGGPVCCCEHGGQPYELEPGLWVTSRNVGCRVHAPRPPAYESISDEPAESWARFKRLAT